MTVKHYRVGEKYIGAFDKKPTGAEECPAPKEANSTFKNGEWQQNDEEKIKKIRVAVSNHIEETARNAGQFGFDSILSAISYAEIENDKVNQKYGAALRDWRSECWVELRNIFAKWKLDGKELTAEEIISQLPNFIEPQ